MRMDFKCGGRVLRAVCVLLVVASLGACATGGGKKKSFGYDQLMSNAESQVTASNFAEALRSFESAAKADPTRKEPWVRMAQLNFDTGRYGRAITSAEEALQRDPADKVAESVLTVGGFRVAAQSLQRLQDSGALGSESAQHEARQLAKVMRDTMGSDIVDEPRARARTRRQPSSRGRASTPPDTAAPATITTQQSANPFDKLGGN